MTKLLAPLPPSQRGVLTLLDAVLVRALMVRVVLRSSHALHAFVKVVLNWRALCRIGALCSPLKTSAIIHV